MNMKKLFLLLLTLSITWSIINVDNAFAEGNALESVDIRVFVNADGSARITERRVGNFIEGTENYNVIENLGKSEIVDFKVSEDGREYQFTEPWDIDFSREEKSFTNGIIETTDGYELAWGIGEYGRHTYDLSYTVTNFVKELQDSQMLFWRFINDETNIPPEKMTLTIESDKPFSSEQERVWGFGFEGNVEFRDGKVVAESTGPLNSSNYVTILLKLPQGLFATGDVIGRTFEDVKEEAFIDSDYESGTSEEGVGGPVAASDIGKTPFIVMIITALFGFLFPLLFVVIIVIIIRSVIKNSPGKFKRKYDEEYYRDYPYEGDILDIYYILNKMGLASFTNILTGFLLKWIYEDRVMTISEEVGIIRKKEKTQTKILNRDRPENALEAELFDMILSASAGDDILEEKEFIKWASKNYSLIDSWEKRVKDESMDKLETMGYINIVKKKKFFITTKDIQLTPSGQLIEDRIYKYINYLYDYSLLNEHEAINVKIWDRIMIWAGFLGVTEVVSKQFENIYPQYRDESAYRGDSIYLAYALTQNVSNARAAASSSSSSGMGGSTSIGGGGGSFGGGSGGGSR